MQHKLPGIFRIFVSQQKRLFSKIVLVFLSIVALLTNVSAQKYTITGIVADSISNESIPGVLITLDKAIPFATDVSGRFSIEAEKGFHSLTIHFIGYKDQVKNFELNKNLDFRIRLASDKQNLGEIEITAKKSDKNVQSTEVGTSHLEMSEIKKLPALLGETDPLKAIQLMPGIQNSGEGNTGFFVRGGGIDQNLTLVDDIPVYNVSHLFGFFSVFNANALQSVDIIKAGMPAPYGGRISSVLDISTKNGDLKKYHAEGGIGLITSNLTLQGPIKKDTASFIISARRTYIDLFKDLIIKTSDKYKSDLFFYDINAKLHYKLNSKHTLTFNTFLGKDDFTYNDNSNNDFANSINWGTKLASLKWTAALSEKVVIKTTLGYSIYKMGFDAGIYNYRFSLTSLNEDITGKVNLKYYLNSRHTLTTGLEYTYHTFSPNNLSAFSINNDFSYAKEFKIRSNDGAVFLSDEYLFSDRLAINGGIRIGFFQQLGPFDRYINDANMNITDTLHYQMNEVVKSYVYPEPRISVRYLLTESSSVKAGFSHNYQYLHLAPVSSMSLPTDVWVPSSSIIKPQYGEQYSIGYFKNFRNNTIETSIEAYYKSMNNLIEYKEGITSLLRVQQNYDNNFYFGKGLGYGTEFFLKKNGKKLSGWVSYTLSWSLRSFDEIEGGRYYHSKNDRRHDVSVTGNYELNSKWMIASVFVIKSGSPITIPLARYFIEGTILNTYSPINSFRMPAYHRMDVSVSYTHKKTEKRESIWVFSIYNLYSRLNPYYIYYETSGNLKNYTLQTKVKQVALFPILPSVTWNFKF